MKISVEMSFYSFQMILFIIYIKILFLVKYYMAVNQVVLN